MSALVSRDYEVLFLALDVLTTHTDTELAEARRQTNHAKQLVLIAMRTRIATVRAKLQAMAGGAGNP